MTWSAYLRRLAIELILFFVTCTIVFYFATGQESIIGAINMGIVASLFYGVLTYILRQRSIRNQDEH